MPDGAEPAALLDSIETLAMEIARHCPDCAERAARIAAFASEVRAGGVDRGTVQDVLETELGDDDVSDVQVRSAAEAVVRASKGRV